MSGAATSGGRSISADLRGDQQFRRYFASRVISFAGSGVTFVAMPVLVYAITGSPLWTALVTVADALPYLVFGLVAGVVADRLPRRRVMVSADVASAVVLASVPVAHHLGVLTPAHVLVAAFATQSLFVFFDGANFAALPALVGPARLAEANAAVFGTTSALDIVVPPLTGIAFSVLDASDLLAADALSFAASAVLVRSLTRSLDPPVPRVPGTVLADLTEGLRFLWQHRLVRTMTWLGGLQAFGGGASVALLVVWADRVLGVRQGDWRLGVVFGAWGVGAVAGNVALPALTRRVGGPRVTLLALPFSAVLGIVLPFATSWLVASALFALWGAAYMVVIVNAVTVRQLATPPALQGRVNTSGRMLSFGLGWPLGALAGGAVASRWGPVAGMVAPATLIAVAAVLAWVGPLRTAPRAVAASSAS